MKSNESTAHGAIAEPRSGPVPDPSVVGVFASHVDAERALRELERAGFDMKRMSIVGKGYHTEDTPVGFYNTGDRVKVWGRWGTFWGVVFGILLTPAFLLVPVVGHVLILGPLASALAGAIGGGAVGAGAGALGAALSSLGIPKDSVIRYETEIGTDKFLLIVHGTRSDADDAMEILRRSDAESVDKYRS